MPPMPSILGLASVTYIKIVFEFIKFFLQSTRREASRSFTKATDRINVV